MFIEILFFFYLAVFSFLMFELRSDLTNFNLTLSQRLKALAICLFWPVFVLWGILTGKVKFL